MAADRRDYDDESMRDEDLALMDRAQRARRETTWSESDSGGWSSEFARSQGASESQHDRLAARVMAMYAIARQAWLSGDDGPLQPLLAAPLLPRWRGARAARHLDRGVIFNAPMSPQLTIESSSDRRLSVRLTALAAPDAPVARHELVWTIVGADLLPPGQGMCGGCDAVRERTSAADCARCGGPLTTPIGWTISAMSDLLD